jgi:H2-forming N5,N10-methylenetetrahydromethanopterin dehydrogenase-like enzyme
MNIQTRKLVLIEEFLRINDETTLTKLEIIIKQEKKKSMEVEMQPMSMNDFQEMIDQSEREIKKGLVVPHEALKKKIKTWK